ncbi:TIGR03086 family metal-binding protein [Streptomyces iconiensis]|uniref:TIGR03086 family metal-binding protein n=1 Tax=Streptomyces iconiensis TaxID=1384038 RepID=A0ABT7A9T3_9ACTN|nr:TIGR03086 family metal-binding protein [Streptomyces iconiensis]MDJ1138055.1 TIGR03086 family metal-binding protein [Streptomyces iconiensis]
MNDMTHAHMKEAAREAARTARGATGSPLNTPTPCGAWDLRALLNHWVLYTAHGLEHRALRTAVPEELAARDFAAEPDWAEAYAAQLDRAVAAWQAPGAWEGDIDLGGSAMQATAIASMVVKEMVLHGWDIATATGHHYDCSPELAGFVLGVVEEYAEIYREYDGFAAAAPVPENATALERALALSGRDTRAAAGASPA